MDAFERGIGGSMFPFNTVSKRFKLIESQTKTIYIPVDEAEENGKIVERPVVNTRQESYSVN